MSFRLYANRRDATLRENRFGSPLELFRVQWCRR
jgi:hypothetical protein